MDKKINLFIKRMQESEYTLALAESMTCGLAAHKLANNVGTSAVLQGSIVCYHESVKTDLLKVPRLLIDTHTAESMQVTEALAKKLERKIPADVHAAITGLASPGGSETKTKPVGTVFFCIRFKKKTYKLRKVFRGTPLEIREKACLRLYDFISRKVLLS